MNPLKRASAGTLESSDVLVEVGPRDQGLLLEVDSVVFLQYGDDIRRTVLETLAACRVTDAAVRITDRGALACVIRARVETALARAAKDELRGGNLP